jgi:ABC-type glycerol-3-phosphate transport system substrate-binding protein
MMSAGNMRLSRRRFLLMALASLTAGCSSTDHFAPGRTTGNAGAEPVWLTQVIGDPEAAARLGRAYLAAHPEYHRSDTLVAGIQQALARYDASATITNDPQQTVAALQQLVRHEYAHGEAEAVDGWILSITEARLYALAALH